MRKRIARPWGLCTVPAPRKPFRPGWLWRLRPPLWVQFSCKDAFTPALREVADTIAATIARLGAVTCEGTKP